MKLFIDSSHFVGFAVFGFSPLLPLLLLFWCGLLFPVASWVDLFFSSVRRIPSCIFYTAVLVVTNSFKPIFIVESFYFSFNYN